jgi:hypothetical protein
MWVYNHLICAEIEIALVDNQSPIFQPHLSIATCFVWGLGGLFTIPRVLANFQNAKFQKGQLIKNINQNILTILCLE